jgi:amino-acid N-acetyltransferase
MRMGTSGRTGTSGGKGDILVRRASLADVEQMHALINRFASQGWMLAKSRHNLYQNIRDFYVAEKRADSDRGSAAEFAGCAALHVLWVDLGEIRSLAVEERFQKNGVGRVLIAAVLRDAMALKLPRVVALTYQRAFFEHMGFVEVVDKSMLPQKVWGECMDCPKFPNCDEIAMVADSPFVTSGVATTAALTIGEL